MNEIAAVKERRCGGQAKASKGKQRQAKASKGKQRQAKASKGKQRQSGGDVFAMRQARCRDAGRRDGLIGAVNV
ncbi:hypothetical protein [Burkholderia multivorans]|uniref:hypothetical protein n=1 Tax=Burkholderia multivorans TaxID=87883 RepID=UPI001689BB42|nr:hypothetical protein [Burkholderia multivorans]